MSNSFNSFFTNIGPSLATKIPPTNAHFSTYLHNSNAFSFFLTPTNAAEIIRVCDTLKTNTSPGFDDISSSVVKSMISLIAEPLAYIFNLSFLHGSVPPNLKVAKVVPIFKTGDNKEVGNYRPISIFPCFSKLLERL